MDLLASILSVVVAAPGADAGAQSREERHAAAIALGLIPLALFALVLFSDLVETGSAALALVTLWLASSAAGYVIASRASQSASFAIRVGLAGVAINFFALGLAFLLAVFLSVMAAF